MAIAGETAAGALKMAQKLQALREEDELVQEVRTIALLLLFVIDLHRH